MKLTDFLIPDTIELNLKSTTKTDAIRELVTLLNNAGIIPETDSVAKIILELENLGTSGIGEGVAIPHGRAHAVDRLVIALGRSKKGIDFESIDKQPVNLIFLLVAPTSPDGPYLTALARISRLLSNRNFRAGLMSAKGKSEILNILQKE